MKKGIIIFFIAGLIFFSCKPVKETSESGKTFSFPLNSYRIMFYNVENLYDTQDDPLTADDEFTPEGVRHWTEYRYREKLNNVYKVIVAVGGWELPKIIGFSEIENKKVLEDLLDRTPLYKSDYKIIHYDSPDRRGIDVGLLYRSEYFTPYFHKPVPVKWPVSFGPGTTRDILLVSGVTNTNDTLHFFVNHWPSRWGGQIETEEKRMFVANILKKHTDSILNINDESKIIIMGDLNDYPTDRSLTESLKAENQFDNIQFDKLYNLSYYLHEVKKSGSYKYQGQWGVLDQMIVSGALLDTSQNIHTTIENVHIFSSDFLMEKDDIFTGRKVKRTYTGYKYNGGYSDHLPVYLDLKIKQVSTF